MNFSPTKLVNNYNSFLAKHTLFSGRSPTQSNLFGEFNFWMNLGKCFKLFRMGSAIFECSFQLRRLWKDKRDSGDSVRAFIRVLKLGGRTGGPGRKVEPIWEPNIWSEVNRDQNWFGKHSAQPKAHMQPCVLTVLYEKWHQQEFKLHFPLSNALRCVALIYTLPNHNSCLKTLSIGKVRTLQY